MMQNNVNNYKNYQFNNSDDPNRGNPPPQNYSFQRLNYAPANNSDAQLAMQQQRQNPIQKPGVGGMT